MGSSVKKNIIYSFSYQALAFLIPLVTSPYIARTLGSEKIGIYSYTYSIAYYFMMIVVLGIMNYGTRSIAKVREDNEKLELTFWSIYIIQFVMLIVSVSLYLFYCIVRKSAYIQIQLCQMLFIVSYGMDITWFFNGKEAFKLIAIRNAIIKVLNAVLVFVLVKKPDDIWIYTLIMSGGALAGQLIQWPYLLKEISIRRVKIIDARKHIKGILILFIPVLATSIFVYMDKIMLGSLSNMSEAGFYENSDKILSMPKAFVQAVGTVMLPHISNVLISGNTERVAQSIRATMFFMIWLACAGVFGLVGISPIFSVVFWGNDFARCGEVITVLSVSLLFSCFGNVIRTQYLIPKERDKEYTISLIAGAIINLIVNYLIISRYGAVGAAIGTIAAEIVLCTYQSWCVRKELEVWFYVKRGLPFVLTGTLMAILIRLLLSVLSYNVINLLLLIIAGAFFYVFLSIVYLKATSDKVSKEMFDLSKNMIMQKFRPLNKGKL